jgi:predicted alpha/beta superfamily hydrolase
MKKLALTVWLLAPVLVIGGLWFMIDRDAARRNREKMRQMEMPAQTLPQAPGVPSAPAGAVPPVPPVPTVPTGPAVKPQTPPDAEEDSNAQAWQPAAPRMVEPEFLPQGFIIVLEDQPKLASQAQPIYLAGNYNGWNPRDPAWVLTPRSDLRWQIIIPGNKSDARLEFKFTRGDWEYEELNEDLSTPSNRMLPLIDASKLAPGEQPVIELVVPRWGDQRPNRQLRPDLDPYFKLNVTGTVRRLQVAGGGVPTMRDLLVWLPPGYDQPENAERRYPVLYLQDGQNVFMKMPTVPAEWGADETATRLLAQGRIEDLIIVAIPHAGAARAREYLPFEMIDGIDPRGVQYVRWLVEEVVPRVNRAFRTKTGPEHTAIGGSSLGAIIALYAATEHPEIWGKVLLESLPLVARGGAAMKFFRERRHWPAVVWSGMSEMELGKDAGSREGNQRYLAAHADLEEMTRSRHSGATGTRHRFVVGPGHVHDEFAWSARLPEALEFLFPLSK